MTENPESMGSAPAVSPPGILERLGLTLMLAAMLAALGLAFTEPEALLVAPGTPSAPAMVHLITLGGVLGMYFALQRRAWTVLYTEPGSAVGHRHSLAFALVLALQGTGLATMAWGFFHRDVEFAYIGGHYIMPAAILIFEGLGAFMARNRPPGRPFHIPAHLPGLGLLLVAALGAMLVLDARTGQYGIYTPGTILLHVLSAGFLFVFPLIMQEAWGQELRHPHGSPEAKPIRGGVLHRMLGLLAAGVLLAGVGQVRPEWTWATPLGLTALGGALLWVGLPGGAALGAMNFSAVRRTPWAAVGMLVLFVAIRVYRGAGGDEMLALVRLSVVLFLFMAALPDLLSRLGAALEAPREAEEPAPGGQTPDDAQPSVSVALHYAAQIMGSGLLVAALATDAAWLVQGGALIWGVSLLVWGIQILRR